MNLQSIIPIIVEASKGGRLAGCRAGSAGRSSSCFSESKQSALEKLPGDRLKHYQMQVAHFQQHPSHIAACLLPCIAAKLAQSSKNLLYTCLGKWPRHHKCMSVDTYQSHAASRQAG